MGRGDFSSYDYFELRCSYIGISCRNSRWHCNWMGNKVNGKGLFFLIGFVMLLAVLLWIAGMSVR